MACEGSRHPLSCFDRHFGAISLQGDHRDKRRCSIRFTPHRYSEITINRKCNMVEKITRVARGYRNDRPRTLKRCKVRMPHRAKARPEREAIELGIRANTRCTDGGGLLAIGQTRMRSTLASLTTQRFDHERGWPKQSP